MSDVELLAEMLGALTAETVYQSDLAEADPNLPNLRLRSALFTAGVDALRSHFPNPRISALMRRLWDLVGHNIVPVVLGADVQTLYVAAMRVGGEVTARILMPDNWPDMVTANPVLQYGALVWVGSQAVDCYSDRISAAMAPRARAHEAEFYRTWERLDPAWSPTPYQRLVLANYPEGLDTAGVQALLYEPREIVTA